MDSLKDEGGEMIEASWKGREEDHGLHERGYNYFFSIDLTKGSEHLIYFRKWIPVRWEPYIECFFKVPKEGC